MRSNKKPILIIIIILIILILAILGSGIYLYLTTDFLKTNQELFAKYLNQNINKLSELGEFSKLDEISNKLNKSNYENETKASIKYDENEVLLNLYTQKDGIENKSYTDIDLINNNENILNAEIFIKEDMLSLRFTDIVKQFISIRNNNLKELMTNLGMKEDVLNFIPDKIEFDNNSPLENIKFTNEELQTLKNNYISIITSNISKDNYQKQSKAMITINNNTITTNAYILELSGEQYKKIILSVLENLENDEIILQKLRTLDEEYGKILDILIEENYTKQIQSVIDELQNKENFENIKYTIYEQNGNTVRIKIEKGLSEVLIDTISSDEILGIDIKITNMQDEKEEISKISISKSKAEKYDLSLDISNLSEDENNNATFEISATNIENNIKLNVYLIIQDIEINLNSNINIVDEINYKVELDNRNNVVLNDLDAEKCKAIIELVGNKVVEKYQDKFINILMNNMSDNTIEESTKKLENFENTTITEN